MAVKNILYAEDNPDDAFILKLALKRSGLSCSLNIVEDGEGAIAWLKGQGDFADRVKHPLPDVLILDLKMPKSSGFDVLQWLKEAKELKRQPVIILSSSDDPRDIKRATELGATNYIMKSASCADVVGCLKTL